MKFANASNDFLKLNPHLADTRTPPELERAPVDAALAAPQTKAVDSARCFVRVTSVRKRLLDPDNLSPKYHIDALRYAQVISGDSPDKITLKVEQRKAKKGEAEFTEIQIDWL